MDFAEIEYWTRAVRDYARAIAGAGGEAILPLE